MKSFSCLDEAFHHQNTCPFCDKVITRGYTQISFNGGETLVEFSLYKASITLDYHSGEIREYSTAPAFQEIATRSYPVYSCNGSAQSATRAGKELFRVICNCNDCGKYAYVLQVHVDMDLKKVIGIFLNSETFSFEKGSHLYEVKNIYATNKTEYSSFTNYELDEAKPSDKQSITLPLIPMDLSNPEKTLERIKTLIVFS